MDSELKHGASDEASRNNSVEFYKTVFLADSVGRAIAYAIEQPADVGINENGIKADLFSLSFPPIEVRPSQALASQKTNQNL